MVSRTILAAVAALLAMQSKDELRSALKDEFAGREWIYDDMPAALAAAKASGRPILAVVR
jgi:hypothetical protein